MIKFGLKYLAKRTNPNVPAAEVKASHRKVLDNMSLSYSTVNYNKCCDYIHTAAIIVCQLWDAYGVETFRTKKGLYYYVNSGDTYTPTIIFPVWGGRQHRKAPFVSSWGDVLEEEGSVD